MAVRNVWQGLAYIVITLGLTHLGTKPVSAGITLTLEGPGLQTTTLTDNVYVESFDSLISDAYHRFSDEGIQVWQNGNYLPQSKDVVSAPVKQTVALFEGYIAAANQFGGTNGKGNFLNGNARLKFQKAQSYLGFWWSAADGGLGDTRAEAGNGLELYANGQLIQKFSTQSILDLLSGLSVEEQAAYKGNPNTAFNNAEGNRFNDWEFYGYVNFWGTDGSSFDEVRFVGDWFEVDNLAFATAPGQVSVPEPLSMLGILTTGSLSLAVLRRRARPSH